MKSRINAEKIKNNIIIGWIKFKNLVKEHKYISSVLGLFLISCVIGVAVFAQEDEYAGKIMTEIKEVRTSIMNKDGVLEESKEAIVDSFGTIAFEIDYYLNFDLPDNTILSRDVTVDATVDTKDVDVYWYQAGQDDGSYNINGDVLKAEMYDKIVGNNNSAKNELKLYLKVNNVENDKEIGVTIKIYESTSEGNYKKISKSFKVKSNSQNLTAKIKNGSAYKKDGFNGRYVPYGILLGFEGDSLKGKHFSNTEIILEASQELNGQIQQLSLDTTRDYYGVYEKNKKLLSNFPNGKYDDTDSSVKDSGSVSLEKLESEMKSSQIEEKKSSSLYLLGDKKITLEVNEKYDDPGVSLSNKGSALGNDKYKTIFKNSKNEEINDYNAMVSKEGTYKIGYVYENDSSKTTIYRNVEVIAISGDKSVSVDGNSYSLNGNTNINLIKGEKYEELGILKNGKLMNINSDSDVTIEITKDDNIETAGGKIIYTIISKSDSSTQELLKRNVNVIENAGEVGIDEKVLNASTVEQCTGEECKISYHKDDEEIKDISSVQSGTYNVEYKLSNEDYEVVIRSTITIEKKIQYKLKIENIKTDDIYYKDNNFIVLGAYFVNVMSERPEGNTDDIPVTLKIVKINDLGVDNVSGNSNNPNFSEGVKTSTLDYYTEKDDDLELLRENDYLSYGEEVILRSEFSYSKDGDNAIESLSVKVPVNTVDNQFSMVEYSTGSEKPEYDVDYDGVEVKYYNKSGAEVKFSDEALAYIIYTAKNVSPGTNIDFRVRLKVNSINHGKSAKLSGATCNEDGKNITVDIKTQSVTITSFKARTTILVDDSDSDIGVDGSTNSTLAIYPSVSRPASVINTQAVGTNELAYVNLTVTLPSGMNYVYNDEYDKPTISSDGRTLTYKILGKKINDWFEPINIDTNFDINIENGTKLTVKVKIDAATKDEPPITDISSVDLRTTERNFIFQNDNNIRFSLTANYSTVSKNTSFDFSSNIYNSESKDTSMVVILPYDEGIESSKKSYNGTYTLNLLSLASDKVYCTKENSSSMVTSSDGLASSEIWNSCDDFKGDSYAGVTAIKVVGSNREMKNTIRIIPKDNKTDDKYEIRAYLYDNKLKKISNKETIVKVISKKITGTVWEDFDDNGIMDLEEAKIQDVVLKLYNVDTKEYVGQAISDNKGQYTLSDLEPGKYYVTAEFNTAKYGLTHYMVNENKAETSSFNANPSNNTISTDIIEITNDTVAINNVNLGLSLKKVYTVKLTKYVSKVITTNSLGISTVKDFGNVTLAKVDVKDLSNLTIKVVYTIELENTGYYPGYIYTVKDYIPDGMKFNEEYEENKGWELSDEGYVSNSTLFDELVYSGDKKYLTIAFDVTRKEAGSFINYASVEDEDLHILTVADSNGSEED